MAREKRPELKQITNEFPHLTKAKGLLNNRKAGRWQNGNKSSYYNVYDADNTDMAKIRDDIQYKEKQNMKKTNKRKPKTEVVDKRKRFK